MTILNSYEAVAGYLPGWSFPSVLSAIFALILLIGVFESAFSDSSNIQETLFLAGIMLFFAIMATYAYHIDGDPIYATRYEVTLNDTVSFIEIAEKYDIIEQRGDIYVLQEKSQD